MNKSFMGIMLAAHALWVDGDPRGTRWVSGIGADMSGADMSGADMRGADMSGADMRGADMRGADMRVARMSGADMSGADMRGADMRGARMSGADMRGADMRGARMSWADRLIGPQRSDGYQYTYCMDTKRVHAGCRCMTIAEYREHASTYPDEAKRKEVFAILDCLELLAEAR